MTTELSKLQIENPPKKNKNERGELVHGHRLSKVACPEEVKGSGHSAAEAMMVKNEGEKTRQRDRPNMHSSEMGECVGRGERSKADAQKLFAAENDAAQSQTVSPWS